MDKNKLLIITGPTASGKTILSIEIAHQLNGEIICADSMQIYSGMSVGTAAPDTDEMRMIPHHLFGCVDPKTELSCSSYKDLARNEIGKISSSGKLPVLCGGTGLYIDSVISLNSYSEDAGKNQEFRSSMEKFLAENGKYALHDKLETVDPVSASSIHPNNTRRVIRALEIHHITGIRKSDWDFESKKYASEYDYQIVVLDFHDRELLYHRINSRVDDMVSNGLIDEAFSLYSKGLLSNGSTASQAIGYKELIPYFNGECKLEDCIENIKCSSRKYAKRQQTWEKKYTSAVKIFADNIDGTYRSSYEQKNEAIDELCLRKFI